MNLLSLRNTLALALAAGLLALPSCGGGSTTVGGGGNGGGGGGGGGGGAGLTFKLEDLEGDWVGQLSPAAIGSTPHNFYLRFDGGQLIEAAESSGGEWSDLVASMGFAFNSKGVLKTDLRADLGSSRLLLTGQMENTLEGIAGSFTLRDANGSKLSGSFTLTRSIGAGQFDQDMLNAGWDGLGQGHSGKFRFLHLRLDSTGTVVNGRLKHPDTQEKIRHYSAGSGTFTFFDSAVGRLENVVVVADSGHTITFAYLLMSAEGTLLAGPGEESGLGAGIAELMRSN